MPSGRPPWRPTRWSSRGRTELDSLPSYRDGWFQVQDEGALLVAPLCRPRPGQRVLDACAAPGGKTTHLAQLMSDGGRILASDRQPGRLRLLAANARRLRLDSIACIASNGTAAPPWSGVDFHRILVDAPCSGLGVLGRHPDIKWRRGPGDLPDMQATQLALLEAQRPCLAADGLLVYSVCSNEPEETDEGRTDFPGTPPGPGARPRGGRSPEPAPATLYAS